MPRHKQSSGARRANPVPTMTDREVIISQDGVDMELSRDRQMSFSRY